MDNTINRRKKFSRLPIIGNFDIAGQVSLQIILPLVIILIVITAMAIAIPLLPPTKMLALAVGMVIFIISFASTEIALYVLIFSMLLSPEFIVGATQGATVGRGITLRLDDILIGIIGLSWLAKMAVKKDLGLFLRTPLNGPIAIYIIVCLISTLFGVMYGRVQLKTGFFFVLKYFEYTIVYFMAVNYIANKGQLQKYFWALLITCAIVSVFGLAQIPAGGRVTAPFEGQSGEPNTFGGYLVLMISLAVGQFLTDPSFRNRLIYIFLTVLFTIPFLYTQSRSSYLAIVPALFCIYLLHEKKLWLISAFVLICILLPFLAPKEAKERIDYTFTQGLHRKDVVTVGDMKLDTSLSSRLRSWNKASKAWIEHPVLGYGVTGYRFVDAQYVRVLVETGLLGLGAFFLLIYTIFRQSLMVYREAEGHFERGLSIGFLAGFTGLLIHSLGANTFIIVRIMEPFWFATAMVMMIPTLEGRRTVVN